jgi:hypothetical protein
MRRKKTIAPAELTTAELAARVKELAWFADACTISHLKERWFEAYQYRLNCLLVSIGLK